MTPSTGEGDIRRIAAITITIIALCLASSQAAQADSYGTTKAEAAKMTRLLYRTFGSGWAGHCFVRIMWRESGGNPRAANYHDWYGGSYGLLQINAVHRWRSETMAQFRARMWNPATHLVAARRLYDSSGFRAWGGCP